MTMPSIPRRIVFPFGGYDQSCLLDRYTPTGYGLYKCIQFAGGEELHHYILRNPDGQLVPRHEYHDAGRVRPGRPPVASKAKRWTLAKAKDF